MLLSVLMLIAVVRGGCFWHVRRKHWSTPRRPIDPGLEWFIDIFLLAIKTAEKPERNLQRRLTVPKLNRELEFTASWVSQGHNTRGRVWAFWYDGL